MGAALVWFRRDLRDFDHAALYHALKSAQRVYCAFIFDTEILDSLHDKVDRRVEFILESVRELRVALQEKGGELIVLHGAAREEIPKLARQLEVDAVHANRDYEPAAVARDNTVEKTLREGGISLHLYKDQAIFEQDEVLTQSGKSFGVFTPYKNAWLRKLDDFYVRPYPIDRYADRLARPDHPSRMPSLADLSFEETNLAKLKIIPGMRGGQQLFEDFENRIDRYREARDYPAVKGPSYLSVHLRFGTVSIRHLARRAWQIGGSGAETWLGELIWRDFYFQILHHHPQVADNHSFKPEYEHLNYPGDHALFQAWCEARTGYPLVDAAMRQINQTGYMHNRLRMVAASFLVKDLLVDWRWGERYFAQKLIDYDMSANTGGWQWAASTGCDAQPWFRIFNPVTQSEKFDPQGKFIRKYVPELAACDDKEIHAPWLMPEARQRALGIVIGEHYPAPLVDHATQREHALALYKQAS